MKNLFILLLLSLFGTTAGAVEGVVLIVNADNPVPRMSTEQIAELYLKRKREWPNGAPVRFFDRTDETDVRKIFLRSVLRKTGRELELFWIGQKLYTGDSAPMQVGSDAMVESLVSRFYGGIGYVSSVFRLSERVKKVEITGNP